MKISFCKYMLVIYILQIYLYTQEYIYSLSLFNCMNFNVLNFF